MKIKAQRSPGEENVQLPAAVNATIKYKKYSTDADPSLGVKVGFVSYADAHLL